MPVQFKDYYETLGVPRTAGADELKKAFRKLAREHHPDVAKNKKQAEEKFKEINEAYEVLGDPDKRKKYDELGPNWKAGSEFRPPPGWRPPGGGSFRGGQTRDGEFEFEFGGTGFSDFFEQVFGSKARGRGFGGFGGAARPGGEETFPERGRDIEGDILVTLDEASHGSVRSVTVRHAAACPQCNGRGELQNRACSNCGGNGHVEKSDHHQVRIPVGVSEGQRLRIAGRGDAGIGGGAAGDLFLRVRFAKHPDFEVQEHTLIYEVDLSPWEAVLGTQISVPTLAGRVSIKIPPGTQNGHKLRVRGRGLPKHGGGHGDLIIITRVVFPERLSATERKLWEQMARESKFNPRE